MPGGPGRGGAGMPMPGGGGGAGMPMPGGGGGRSSADRANLMRALLEKAQGGGGGGGGGGGVPGSSGLSFGNADPRQLTSVGP